MIDEDTLQYLGVYLHLTARVYVSLYGKYESLASLSNWAVAWDFKQCGMCNQQNLRPACAYAQPDQSIC